MARGIGVARLTSTIVSLAFVLAMIAACSSTPQLPPRAQGEPAPQIVVATEMEEEPLASCGGVAFPAAVLEEPIGPNDLLPPEFEGLNEILCEFRTEFRLPDDTIWRLAVRNGDRAAFLTQRAGDWIYATVRAEGNGWRARGMGECRVHGVVSGVPGAASWWLDNRVPPPTVDSIELPVLVQDAACSSGTYATGRISSPLVQYTADSVVIFAAVREIGGSCLLSPATPAVFILPQPIGDRQLLDGYHVPPAPPREPEW